MIPRYHGRWSTMQLGDKVEVLIVWDREHHQYRVREVGTLGPTQTFGRNGIRRWLQEVKAAPVDGQQPVT